MGGGGGGGGADKSWSEKERNERVVVERKLEVS